MTPLQTVSPIYATNVHKTGQKQTYLPFNLETLFIYFVFDSIILIPVIHICTTNAISLDKVIKNITAIPVAGDFY